VKSKLVPTLLCVALALPAFAQKVDERITESTAVLKAMAAPGSMPPGLLKQAKCVVIYPRVKKVSIGIGVSYGRGVLSCRTGPQMNGKWSAPAMYRLDTGSLGVQLGGSSTDYVLVIMTEKGADKILSGKLKLGADASAVAGPSGAKAVAANDTNIDVLTYSRAQGGLFAGASLASASLDSDSDANKQLYGKDVDATQIIRDGAVPVPAVAQPLISGLNRAAP
jgi:lipid-binding SYLF domain-containing protein